jgi:acyl carrier protein
MDLMEAEIKQLIVQALKLEDITWQDVDSVAPLFGEGLGLDSIDALELGVAIRQRYSIKIDAVNDQVRAHFFNVRSFAHCIASQREKDSVAR